MHNAVATGDESFAAEHARRPGQWLARVMLSQPIAGYWINATDQPRLISDHQVTFGQRHR